MICDPKGDAHEYLARLDEERSRLAARVSVLGEWDGLPDDELAARRDEWEAAKVALVKANVAFNKLEALVYTMRNGLSLQ